MTITILFNTMSHHIKPLCDELYTLIGDNFTYIQTKPMRKERLEMGWGMDISKIPYVKCLYEDPFVCRKIIDTSDLVLFGSAPLSLLRRRIKDNLLTAYVAERIFRKGIYRILNPKIFYTVYTRYILPGRNSNFFMFSASAYTAYDMYRIHAFRDKYYKWGHFLPLEIYTDLNEFRKKNSIVKILWCGRFLPLKHPEYALALANELKKNKIDFRLYMIGDGSICDNIKKMCNQQNLSKYVSFLGMKSPKEVRAYMLESDIFLFTSDFQEGWGAVLNEAMNSGCAVLASSAPGSVPFLIKNNKNGLIYQNMNLKDFLQKGLALAKNKDLRLSLGKNAYETIVNEWSPKIAAVRLVDFLNSHFKDSSFYRSFQDGPLSEAFLLHNNWFK